MIKFIKQHIRERDFLTVADAVTAMQTLPDTQIQVTIKDKGTFLIDAYEWNDILKRAKSTIA